MFNTRNQELSEKLLQFDNYEINEGENGDLRYEIGFGQSQSHVNEEPKAT